MLKSMTEYRYEEVVTYSQEYEREDGSGCTFKTDKYGELLPMTDRQLENYKYCVNHPQEFTKRYGEFVARKNLEVIPPEGICDCGQVITLVNQCAGACKCPKCGQWYNLFGEEILFPK